MLFFDQLILLVINRSILSTSGFSINPKNCLAYEDKLSTYLLCHSAYKVSKAKEDLPEPESPVITTNLSLGISKSIFFKLCSFAPFIIILSFIFCPLFLIKSIIKAVLFLSFSLKIFTASIILYVICKNKSLVYCFLKNSYNFSVFIYIYTFCCWYFWKSRHCHNFSCKYYNKSCS